MVTTLPPRSAMLELKATTEAPTSDAATDNDFQALVRSLSDILGPSSGIDSADVDPDDLQELMRSYESAESEWHSYAFSDPSRNYTRNLVDEGNGKSNLVRFQSIKPAVAIPLLTNLDTQLIVVWNPGKSSPIHDHANAHCVMKILKGSLVETLYAAPEDETARCCAPRATQTTCYKKDEVTYICDDIGLHKIGVSVTHWAMSSGDERL